MKYTKKYVIVFLLGIIGFFAFFIPVKNFAEQKKSICKDCNVILITLDILGSNHLPCYGYERNTAPNLCKFAEDNVFFTRSYSQHPLTLQSTFSILTSLYINVHRMKNPYENTKLDNKYRTLPEVLQKSGYDSVYFGKIDTSQIPFSRGVERGFSNIMNTGIQEWKKEYRKLLENNKENKSIFSFFYSGQLLFPYRVEKKEKFLYTTDYFDHIPSTTENMFNFSSDFFSFFMKSLASRVEISQTNESKNYTLTMYKKLKNTKNIDEEKKVFETLPYIEQYAGYQNYYYGKIDIKNNKQIEYLKALYDERIHMTDEMLGKFLNFLQENKEIADNTIIVITSQHGEEFMEHGAFAHGYNLYNTTTSVPLIFSIPNVKNKKIDELVQNIDVYPTILGLLGLKPLSPLQGKDLSDLIYQMPNAEKNEYVISEDNGDFLRSIQEKDWKLYVRKNGILELHHTKTDPGEYTNVLLQYPHIAGRMLDTLNNVFPSQYEEKKEYNFPLWIDEIKKQKIIKEGYF